ncbi:MAG TPA: hypothetical protein VGZ22_27925 [Isosphaeraceae bacterium]|nr:hypothetical protein [Isosphaeraceae bacterium]
MHFDLLNRRQFLQAGAAALVIPALGSSNLSAGTLRFRLTETAGLRRFGYPVFVLLPKPDAMTRFRLKRGDQPVPAQFRATTTEDGRPAIALDFNASPGPLETEEYTIAYGDDVEAGPEPKGGLRVEHKDGAFRVVHGPDLRFAVADDLKGVLRAVGAAGSEYLREGSEGLRIRSLGGVDAVVGGKVESPKPLRSSVTREGPLAVGLRFEGSTSFGDRGSVSSVVNLTFPSSKSWVEIAWNVDDPAGIVGAIGARLDLAIEETPTLVDLGASNTVYGHIQGLEQLDLKAGRADSQPPLEGAWVVRRWSSSHRPSLLAVAPKQGGRPAEGWAHVMDRSRCTAVAVADFGGSTRDKVTVDGNGRVILWRENFEAGRGPKQLRFWLHFVPMPVQVGAATSPQAMLAPLKVEWLETTT